MSTLLISRNHTIIYGLCASAAGMGAIMWGDHHSELPHKLLVAAGVALVLMGLFLLRFSWTLGARR